jgi:hypothetical protein
LGKTTYQSLYEKPTQKDKQDNYQIITIANKAQKIYEKILFKRLLLFTEKQNVLPPMQYGFRQGKSMLDIVMHLVTNMWRSFKRRQLTESVSVAIMTMKIQQLKQMCPQNWIKIIYMDSYAKDISNSLTTEETK